MSDRDDVAAQAQLLHDLRQPLAAIVAAASALRANTSVDEPTRDRLLAIVVDNAGRLSDMLDEALGSSEQSQA